MNAAWSFLLDVFGGRQSARSIHFIVAWLLFAFLVLHLVLLALHKPLRNTLDMITGGGADEAA
jgi:thiosulfate reductase cytochrome b subunit